MRARSASPRAESEAGEGRNGPRRIRTFDLGIKSELQALCGGLGTLDEARGSAIPSDDRDDSGAALRKLRSGTYRVRNLLVSPLDFAETFPLQSFGL
jgi:hypothetical protein